MAGPQFCVAHARGLEMALTKVVFTSRGVMLFMWNVVVPVFLISFFSYLTENLITVGV